MADFWGYMLKHGDRLCLLALQHLRVVVFSELIAMVFALPVGFFLSKARWLSELVLGLFSILYSIPSLAMFTFFLPMTGLGTATAVLVIAIYAQFILLRGTVAGFRSVDPAVLEVGRGLGMSAWELFSTVELPLAAPVIVSGVRISAVASVAMTTIAATIGGGGIGVLLFEGLRTIYAVKIMWGVVLSASLCLAVNYFLSKLERWLLLKARGEISRNVPVSA